MAGQRESLRCLGLLVAAALVLSGASARAGGLWIWETGTAADIGTAGASWGAGMQDASTAWSNPAAMTLVERSEVGLQLSPSAYRYRFDADGATNVTGGSGANTSFVPLSGGAGVFVPHPRLRIGAALGGSAGGAVDYGDSWSGRYMVTTVALNILGFNPGVAWRASDWLSLGSSLVISYADFSQRARVRNLLPGQPDGKLRIEDSDVGFGGVFGALVEPLEGTRIAVTYRTPVDFDLRDHLTFSNILPPLDGAINLTGVRGARIKLDMQVPQQVLLALHQQVTDELAVVFNADWEDWSEFLPIDLQLASEAAQSASTELHTQDTWHLALGLRWRPQPRWLLTTGVGYDSSMFTHRNRSPVLPVDRQYRVAAGVQYDWSKDLFLGFSYEYMNGSNASLNAGGGPLTGQLEGHYSDNDFHFFTVSLNWRP